MKRLALLLLITGCREPRIIYQRVEVPIAVPCPEPPSMAVPDLPVFHLPPNPHPSQVASAYAESLAITLGKLREAIAILNGYRPQLRPGVPHGR